MKKSRAGKKNYQKPVHYVQANETRRTLCGNIIAGKLPRTYLQCLVTCEACRAKLSDDVLVIFSDHDELKKGLRKITAANRRTERKGDRELKSGRSTLMMMVKSEVNKDFMANRYFKKVYNYSDSKMRELCSIF